MEVNISFDFYGNYEVSNLKKLILDPDINWDYYTMRQKVCYEMRNTKTVPVIFNPNFLETSQERFFYPIYEKVTSDLENISKIISTKRGSDGYIHNAIFVKLFKNKNIPPHKDVANKIIQKANRIHIPIQTNKNCFFTIGEETKNLKEGEIWEINNDKLVHSVSNDGDEDRIHLIVDWFDKN